jgi:hypothetical protein
MSDPIFCVVSYDTKLLMYVYLSDCVNSEKIKKKRIPGSPPSPTRATFFIKIRKLKKKWRKRAKHSSKKCEDWHYFRYLSLSLSISLSLSLSLSHTHTLSHVNHKPLYFGGEQCDRKVFLKIFRNYRTNWAPLKIVTHLPKLLADFNE